VAEAIILTAVHAIVHVINNGVSKPQLTHSSDAALFRRPDPMIVGYKKTQSNIPSCLPFGVSSIDFGGLPYSTSEILPNDKSGQNVCMLLARRPLFHPHSTISCVVAEVICPDCMATRFCGRDDTALIPDYSAASYLQAASSSY
jgi:hypothetical protein